MRLLRSSILLVAATGVAAAQPAPAEPIPDPAADWSPYDDDGWPRGVSLEDVRGLPACAPGQELPGPGEPIPCRPLVLPEVPQWGLGVDWTTGIVDGDAPLTGGAHALGVQLDFGLSRSLQLGIRYELMGFGLHDLDPDAIDVGLGHRVFGQARYRLFTDEVDRDAWTLTLGGGYAFQEEIIGGIVPAARVAIGREIGMYLDDENALTTALELAWERTFADVRTEAILASARFGFEVNIREPANLGTEDTPHSARYLTGVDVYAGPALGLGYSLGVPFGRHLSLFGTASFMFGRTDFRQQGFDGSQWALQAGPRLSLGWPGPAPLYVQLQAGPAWIADEPERQITTVADLEIGLGLFAGCSGVVDVGLRSRAEVDGGVDLMSAAMVLRLSLGPAPALARGRRCGPGGGSIAFMPTPPPPPQPIESYKEPVLPAVEAGGGVEAGGAVEVDAGAGVETGVDLEIEPPEPVVVEVELGAVAFGGLVEVSIDPRLLPLDRLRRAGYVEVELSGPGEVLAEYQASMTAVLDDEGLAVDAWAFARTGGHVIRATITIWPPGSRPE